MTYLRRFFTELLIGVAMLAIFTGVFLHAQMPAPLGPYGNVWVRSTATDTATLSTQQMYGLLTGTPTAAANYTTATATNLCALFPFLSSQNAAPFAWDWYVKNTSGGANTITVVAGAGVTLVGTGTAAQNNVRHYKIEVSACSSTPAASIVSLETAAF
jgi:hypothetical protein